MPIVLPPGSTGRTFADMQGEVYARGFSYLNDGGAGSARVKRWINDAMHSIDDEERWDYRKTSEAGVPPWTVTDLGEIESVVDTGNQNALAPATSGELVGVANDALTGTGTATYFYLDAGVLSVWPVATGSVTVTYWKVSPDLSGDTDTPLMPDRFRSAIVERALEFAYRDSDDPEMSGVCGAAADRIVDRMRQFYVLQPGGQRQTVLGFSEDW